MVAPELETESQFRLLIRLLQRTSAAAKDYAYECRVDWARQTHPPSRQAARRVSSAWIWRFRS